MCEVYEIESDSDDIFEVMRIKPVAKLTKERALEIRNHILDEEGKHFENDASTNEESKTPMSEPKISHCESESNGTPTKCNVNNSPSNISPSKKITDYYTPTKSSPKSATKRSCDSSTVIENIQLSPALRKSKKFKINQSPTKSPVAKPKIKLENSDTVTFKQFFSADFDDLSAVSTEKKEIKPASNSHLYFESLKSIIHFVISTQVSLEEDALKKGKSFSKLFLDEDYAVFEKFFELDIKACYLFSRMLCRKKYWHRVETIKYSDISDNINEVFDVLHEHKFVDYNIENESMEVQLDLLTKPEIQFLCRGYNIKIDKDCGNKKQNYINTVLKSCQNQRSVIEMWTNSSKSNRQLKLKSDILKFLGGCVKLNESVLRSFNKILLLFSLASELNKEDDWSHQISMMINVQNHNIQYPAYCVQPCVIFEEANDFISYEKAMELKSEFDVAIIEKDYETFFKIGQEAKVKFMKATEKKMYQERILRLPSYLRRFSAGSVYARILTIYCDKFRKEKDPKEIVEIMNMLLSQGVFLIGKKGQWYNILVHAYEEQKKMIEAVDALLKALKDDSISDVDRLTLQLRGQTILKKKKNGIDNEQLRDELDDACTVNILDPPKIEIKAKALSGNEPGRKSVYVQESSKGKYYSSVEEHAIKYYKNNGFTQGIHSEGSIIQRIYFFVFFDIIYGYSPLGVFQTPYQDAPLDLTSRCFYTNRKDAIDARLEEMKSWSMDDFEEKITNVYNENFNVTCVIKWSGGFDIRTYCDIIKCLGIKEFTVICERLVSNFKLYRAGFPDITLWNPDTGRCKFVEVKSPNDKLSPKQRIWLDFLRKLNIDCEVCNVKNTAAKRLSS